MRDISKKIEELPTPDFVVQRIISIASNPESGTKELNIAVLESPTLSAKILKMSNSAYYAIPRKITKLTQAINILGFKTVRNLAMSIFTVNSYFKKEYEYFNTEKFWKHLMGTGIAAELLSNYVNYPEKEEAFLSGMLHDLGKIAMAFVMPDVFEMIVKLSKHKKVSFSKAEEMLQSFSHQQIGKVLFENWNMSDIIIDTATFHDNPNENRHENTKAIVNIVHIANISVKTLLYGHSGSFEIPIPNEVAWNELSLTPQKYKKYLDNLKEKISESQDFMNLNNIIDVEEEK